MNKIQRNIWAEECLDANHEANFSPEQKSILKKYLTVVFPYEMEDSGRINNTNIEIEQL